MKKKIIIIGVFLLFLISMISGSLMIFNKQKNLLPKDKIEDNINETEAELTEEDNNNEVVEEKHEDIERENLQASSSESFKGYRLASDLDKANYEITNISKNSNKKTTTITGRIKNKGGSENFILKVEFKGKQSSSSIEIKDLKVEQEKKFEIKMLNNAVTDDYLVYVEYVGE